MTPHIEAEIDEIAKTVIMPGDPLRTELIAKTYLKDYKLVNKIRNMYAYTGYYNDNLITVMASGMGMGSMGIYSYELFNFYNVENIIRIGSCGAYKKELNLGEIILVNEVYTDSNFSYVQDKNENYILKASDELNKKFRQEDVIEGKILSSDVFYKEVEDNREMYDNHNCLAVEMETFALFHNAKKSGKNATSLLTVSDNFETNKHLTALERQTSFTKMIELVLSKID